MNFYKLVDNNRDVYLSEFGKMSDKIMTNLVDNLKVVRDTFLEIVNEVKD